MDKKQDRRALGRGLSALMADIAPLDTASDSTRSTGDRRISIDMIRPNPNQPRRDFEPAALAELADSIRQKGIIQPLVLRRFAGSDEYEIVAGERRWRAAQLANVHDVPAVIRDYTDEDVLEIAIIENIQRADLNAMEEAMGFRQLIDRHGHTQEKLASALSKSRSHVANMLRLLQLPDDVQNMVRHGKLTAGHARALITSADASGLAQTVVGKGLSVRDTERMVKKAENALLQPKPKGRRAADKDPDTRALEADISANLGMLVRIDHEPPGEEFGLQWHNDCIARSECVYGQKAE